MNAPNNLVRMANDIGNFFKTQPRREDAIAGISQHLLSYWTRPMRERLLAQAAQGEIGLDELAREALQRLADDDGGAGREVPASSAPKVPGL